MTVTLADVAKYAGVSPKTVSRVINNETRVAEATRQKVLTAIKELGYTPNVWAQRLARGVSGQVGLVLLDATSAYLMNIIEGAMDIGDATGYRLGIYRLDNRDPEQIAQFISMAAQHHVEGFIFTPPCDNAPELVGALHRMNFPFVQLSPHDRHSGYAWVAVADKQGAYKATWHLLRLGHQRIGFIKGHPGHMGTWDRLAGYQQALQEAGLPLDEAIIVQGSWDFEMGLECARELLALTPRPTAILAGNDDMAAGVLQATWERGLKCPEDLSVVGFDDVPLARQLNPPLTTIRQPIYEMATTAMLMLIEELIPGKPAETMIELPTELIIRYTTAQCS